MVKKYSKHKIKKYTFIIITLAFLLIVASVAINKLNSKNKVDSPAKNGSKSKTTSKQHSAQPDYSDGGSKTLPKNQDKGAASVTDTKGADAIPGSNTQTSLTGQISVYSPNKNTTISDGSIIAGASSLPRVEYRVIDSVSGVISTGSLAVVNGKFSGSVYFNTQAKEGRIDIYATQNDGNEFSNIEIPVRLK